MLFSAPWFAVAGVAAASGVLVIHLLNRRRFRVVHWAAMDLLRQAIRHNRRILRLQNLLLMVLRMASVLAFGLALAQPRLTGPSVADNPNDPVHAVLVVDNSLSMGYEQLGGSLLGIAQARGREFIKRLPRGSRISVLPACGAAAEFSFGGYHSKEEALETLDSIELVDRAASAAAAIDLAADACRRVPDPATKQIVLLSDLQTSNWPSQTVTDRLRNLPGPFELVQVAPDAPENAWVAEFHLQDGIADGQTPMIFLATIRYQGGGTRNNTQVTLKVDGVPVASQTVDLLPGQSREIRFPPVPFSGVTEPGRPTFVAAEVSISADRLPADDHRFLVVPVVDTLPALFVDQYGQSEDPARNRYGETYRLRRLLAPVTDRQQAARPLMEIRHTVIDRLDTDLLADARLVVVAGISSPEPAVGLLRQYVEQGGQLVIAAGGQFDPVDWTAAGWQNGLGILPAPLEPEPVGQSADEAPGRLEPFQLDFPTMVHDWFLLEQVSREQLEDLYSLPYFFKAVVADVREETVQTAVGTATAKIEEDRARQQEIARQLAELAGAQADGTLTEDGLRQMADLQQELQRLDPAWLLWADASAEGDQDPLPAAEMADQWRPRVLARFTNGVPAFVERAVGRGRILFFSTGVHAGWNTLTTTNAVVILDRILRDMLRQTFPQRNISSTERLVLPAAAGQRRARFTLTAPDGRQQHLPVQALGGDLWGVTVRSSGHRGIYRVAAYGTAETPDFGLNAKLWEIPLAVNGPPGESELAVLDEAELKKRAPGTQYVGTAGQGTSFLLNSDNTRGRNLWRWLAAAVLLGLLVELVILARASHRGKRAP